MCFEDRDRDRMIAESGAEESENLKNNLITIT